MSHLEKVKTMCKLKETLLLLCLIFCGALSYANSKIEKDETPVPIELKESTGVTVSDKSAAIWSTIDGHYLSVSFTENLGQVAIEITTDTGSTVSTIAMTTPNGYVFYIALAGDYIVTFTLPNGDVYYGEFTVTD